MMVKIWNEKVELNFKLSFECIKAFNVIAFLENVPKICYAYQLARISLE